MADLMDSTRDEIIALEKSFWEAMKRKDGAGAADLTANTSLVIGVKGVMIVPKAKMGKMTEDDSWHIESYDFDNVQVITPRPDVAIIAYTVHQKVTMKDKVADRRYADSSTWLRARMVGNATRTPKLRLRSRACPAKRPTGDRHGPHCWCVR